MDALELHRSLVIVDGHCDTALDLVGKRFGHEPAPPRDFLARGDRGHLDLPRLEEGGVTCQFMALFTDDELVGEAGPHTWRLLEAVESAIARSGGAFRLARKAADVLAAKADGAVAALLTIEGGEAVGEDLGALRAFRERGVSLMGLTWNRRNAIGRGAGTGDPSVDGSGGLTDFGRKVVAEMERTGMIVDASHLSDEALDDLLEIAQRPVVASHSNSRVLCPHRRNLEDGQAERIAATGGLVAVTYAGVFVDKDPAKVSLERLVDHVERLARVAGVDHVGIGSDFDGFTDKYGVVLEDCAALPKLTAALLARGFKPGEVAKIMGGNWLRVMEEIVG